MLLHKIISVEAFRASTNCLLVRMEQRRRNKDCVRVLWPAEYVVSRSKLTLFFFYQWRHEFGRGWMPVGVVKVSDKRMCQCNSVEVSL